MGTAHDPKPPAHLSNLLMVPLGLRLAWLPVDHIDDFTAAGWMQRSTGAVDGMHPNSMDDLLSNASRPCLVG